MSAGLFALLDDIAAIAKLTAASLDDVGAAAAKASTKAVGVVIDDTAVTPRYATGFSPDRELPIIFRIAKGSLFNKVVLILPAALLLSQFLPWAITPLLMLGGIYLCYEGAEKLHEATSGHEHSEEEGIAALESAEHEKQMIDGAIRTDFILSAEIMAIALADAASQPPLFRAAILLVVAVVITALVYGVVGIIVKMDDIGLKLAKSSSALSKIIGRGLVQGMPYVLSALSVIGTAAMLWVGGHIIINSLDIFGIGYMAHMLHDIASNTAHLFNFAQGLLAWLAETIVSAIFGIFIGALVLLGMHFIKIPAR